MELEIIFQLFLATFLGALIGLEREAKKKEAGLQTYSLVALGACVFTVISSSLAESNFINSFSIITAIAIGMGFIGAGTIFRAEGKTEGVTTAAGLWATAAIGLAVGVRIYTVAIFSALSLVSTSAPNPISTASLNISIAFPPSQ